MLDIAGQVPWGINRLKKNLAKILNFFKNCFSKIRFLKNYTGNPGK